MEIITWLIKMIFFYIIKGTYYRRVKNLNLDESAVIFSLHPKCQGGDHYMSAWDSFYIIYLSQGFYRKTKNMSTDENIEEYSLHPECSNGLYYFGTEDYYYFVKPRDEWGIQYVKCTNFNKNIDTESFSLHPSVINFLPGGVGVSKGPAYGEWVCIKTIVNDSKTPVQWQKKVTKKSGYEKEKMCTIEHNWSVTANVSFDTGGLSKLICQSQFSLTTEYGGSKMNTERENWNEATETEELLNVILQPDEKMYIWAFQLCMGNDPVLYCRDIRILANSDPPTDVPLPPAEN
ncbi:uncharacterized protein [Engystomops pustulosus]|uniref:uncharacterized protein n=1 Tax=Engystomops pustulosus TaxID=76066 RepID=UPI003AFA1AEA